MDDERSSPGVGPRTWVTLGLLLFSWVIVVAVLVRASLAAPGWSLDVARVQIGTLTLIPHVLWAYVAWRGRRTRVSILALLAAIAFGWLTFPVAEGMIHPFLPEDVRTTLRHVGLGSDAIPLLPLVVCGAFCVLSLPTALRVWWVTRRKPTAP